MAESKSKSITENECFTIESTVVSQSHDVYLSDEVKSDAFQYHKLFNFLEHVSPDDEVNIHLANFGGACHSGIRIANAIKTCEAPVNIIVTAPCYSMGAIIALCGTGLTMYKSAFLMFHNYSSRQNGKGGELNMAVGEYQRHFKEVLNIFCVPFLSKAEVNKLIKDEDVYIHASDEDLKARLARHYK